MLTGTETRPAKGLWAAYVATLWWVINLCHELILFNLHQSNLPDTRKWSQLSQTSINYLKCNRIWCRPDSPKALFLLRSIITFSLHTLAYMNFMRSLQVIFCLSPDPLSSPEVDFHSTCPSHHYHSAPLTPIDHLIAISPNFGGREVLSVSLFVNTQR